MSIVMMRTCSIDGCGKPYYGKERCSAHYRELRGMKTEPKARVTYCCKREGCGAEITKQVWDASGLCKNCRNKDNYRQRRDRGYRQPRRPCIVPDCTRDRSTKIGYCPKHADRLKKTGVYVDTPSPILSNDQEIDTMAIPDTQNPLWDPNEAKPSYDSVRQHVLDTWGHPSKYGCFYCKDAQAQVYVYDYTDPMNEIRVAVRQGRKKVIYSPDPANYQPACIACARRLWTTEDPYFHYRPRPASPEDALTLVASP